MVPSKSKDLMESYSSVTGLNFEETELSLSLPGESRSVNYSGRKRRFEESVDLKLGSSSSDDCHSRTSDYDEQPKNEISNTTAKPPAKAQVVGWPPVKSTRKNMMKSSKFVKVAVDGAPYLRKVDLETYGSYEQLLTALEDMFSCLGICNIVKEKKLLDPVNCMEYVPTYEDKDGDWMLVGDVPWKMFVESCKRIRLMKGTDKETGLATRASPNCSSTNS